MTEDPYRLDDDLQLSAMPEGNESEDEFDGLDIDNTPKPARSGVKKMPILIGFLALLVVAGGGFYAYQMFFEDTGPVKPLIPPPHMAAAVPPAANGGMPNAAPMATPPSAPNAPGMPPAAPGAVPAPNESMPPVAAAPNTPATPGAPVPAAPVAGAIPAAPNAAATTTAVALPPPAEEPKPAAPAPGAMPAPAANDAAPAKPASVDKAAALTKPDKEADVPPALAAAAEPNPADPTKATSGESVAKADAMPAKDQPLEPIDGAAPVSVKEAKAAKTAAEVNEILKDDKPGSTPKSLKTAAMKLPEVTSHAHQVISVKKAYSASSPQAAIAAGERVMDAQQYGSAAEIFDKQLRNNPSDPRALAGKAEALQRSGNTVEAMNTYDRLLRLNPRDVDALTNYLGLLQDTDPSQALQRLQALSDQYPDNAAVAAQTGSAYAKAQDTPNALRYFLKASALDGTNASYPFNLAVLYDRMGTNDKARSYYNRALDIVRDYPDRASGVSVDAIRQRLTTLSD